MTCGGLLPRAASPSSLVGRGLVSLFPHNTLLLDKPHQSLGRSSSAKNPRSRVESSGTLGQT